MAKKKSKEEVLRQLDREVMERVMGWREGEPLKGGGCRPADAEPTPVVKDGLYKGCEMGSTGGTHPFFYGGTVWSCDGGGRSFSPSEDASDLFEALVALKADGWQVRVHKSGQWIAEVDAGIMRASGLGATPEEALCRALLGHGRG